MGKYSSQITGEGLRIHPTAEIVINLCVGGDISENGKLHHPYLAEGYNNIF